MAKAKMTQAKSKHRRTKPKPPAASPPERFFEKDLAGEEAPSFETMQALFKHAGAIYTARPWNHLEEDELVMFKEPASGELCFCSVMGALGKSSAVQVYIGAQSYFWFRKLHAGEPASLGDYFAHQFSVFVHYVSLSHLTPPDRELARAMGHPLARGTEAPLIRTIRPGYHPWFVTESEARILAQGLQCALVMADYVAENPDDDLWIKEDVYPFMELTAEHPDRLEYNIKRMAGPSEAATMPKLPELDQARIQSILDRRLPSAGSLEVDHFYTAAVIGAKHDRKACMRMALAIDSKTAIAFPPQLGAPEESTGRMLQQVVLEAIESLHALPAAIHVSKREFKILLDPLAAALGFRIKVRDSLPALEFAKGEMQSMLGDPGLAP
jgi:hypothetical protein